jgi:hypothetical protein
MRAPFVGNDYRNVAKTTAWTVSRNFFCTGVPFYSILFRVGFDNTRLLLSCCVAPTRGEHATSRQTCRAGKRKGARVAIS